MTLTDQFGRKVTDKPLSKTMNALVLYARKHGGKIHRYPGGHWAMPHFDWSSGAFNSSTVEALVKRGVAQYTAWRDGRNGRFPIEATLSEALQNVPNSVHSESESSPK